MTNHKENKNTFATPDKMWRAIKAYFDRCDKHTRTVSNKSGETTEHPAPLPYTIEGLSCALEMDRNTLLRYEHETGCDEFLPVIRKAVAQVQQNIVERALTGENNASFASFILKSYFGYNEKTIQPSKEQSTDTSSDSPEIVIVNTKEDIEHAAH